MKRFTAILALACVASSASAQATQPAVPRSETRREIVAVFIGMNICCYPVSDSLREPLALVRRQLADQAMRQGAQFRMVGVALDWSPEEGWEYLRSLGRFDEVSVGSNWRNGQAEMLMWRDSTARPAVPQLVVYEHDVGTSTGAMTFGPRRTIRTLGAAEIGPWARAGAPLR